MNKGTGLTLPLALLLAAAAGAQAAPTLTKPSPNSFHVTSLSALTDTDRDRDGLAGPVRRVRTETVKLSNKGGKAVEGQRAVLESVAYDIKGNKTENAYFPVPGAALTGKEVYKYDDKGNIVEMTLLNADGSLLSKEVYSYEFDQFGNWTKMTTSVAVVEGGKLSYEPTEVTYRMISYYLDEATLARLSQPAAPAAAPATTTAQPAPAAQQNSATAQPAPKTAQTNAVAKPGVPLPSGAALLKTNMTGAADATAAALKQAGGVQPTATVKVEGEPPPAVAAAPRAPRPLLKPVSGGVLNGKALDLPKPGYPPQAKSARASGIVIVEVVIDEKGKVLSAKATSGHTLLRQAAEQAARNARFSPTLLSGQPVKVTGEINYNFAVGQ
ncbi:MAG TPA: energy transducer TonB [Pyrinomonadaceae bacterium]|nr:energy transducer TonB [Pyrinomonadaceae bacterium]